VEVCKFLAIMPAQPQITQTNLKVWTNRHNTYKQPINNLFDIANGDTGNIVDRYNATTASIQTLIGKAIQEKKSLRALGGGWSFSKVATTDGWMLNTKKLNMLFPIKNPQNISSQYPGRKDQLLFAQCGNSIHELNNYLKTVGKSLQTSGASNGQTIVGAIATGTHGSAIDFGSTQDFVIGLHIIVSSNMHVWLERSSYPVVSDTFAQRLQTKLVRDDELFNAALVSFGSFGFIHGVMLETEDIYLLECYRLRIPIDASFKHTMETLDFSNASFLPHGSERPFHFQAVINQYDLNKGAYVMVMYKRPHTDNYQAPVIDFNKAGPGDDVPAFLGKLTDIIPALTPISVNNLIKTQYALYSKVFGTSGEIFTNNNIRGKILSTAMGVPIRFVNEVNDLLIELNKIHGPFTGVFSYRYVKKSAATLAFTKYDHTCIIELDGVQSGITQKFYEIVWSELERRNIPYTLHWGKRANLNSFKLQNMYGENMDRWLAARNKLLPVSSLTVFNSPTLQDWGLDKILQPF
jgi:hypothetical protein